jgi:hypothetical protein
MNKIYCFGDGYAANHIWPEWPAIVSALYPQVKCQNFGAIGAGNEFISSAVIQAYLNDPTAIFLIQWAQFNRYDKLIEDNTWDKIIDSDPVYNFNRVCLVDQKWWLSSASQQTDVKQYHSHFIQPEQAKLRTFNYIFLIQQLLKDRAIHFSTCNLPWDNLIKPSMSMYSDQEKFKEIRGNEIQPAPPVHMAWLEEYILPKMPIQPDILRLNELKHRINKQQWKAYDPDREEIWQNIITF